MLNTAGDIYINVPTSSGSWLGWSPVGAGTGSGATPAVASQAIVASFNNYEFALNPSGQPLLCVRSLRALEYVV